MGKAFLYGRTMGKDIADLFLKLTVYCSEDAVVRVKSVDSSIEFYAKADINGETVFNRMTPGYWDISLVDVANSPVKRIKIDSVDYTVNINEFISTINITYPADSICTITNGIKTYTAPDTSGSWTCVIYNAGEWFVSCNSDERYDSKNINLTINEQTVDVTLKYLECAVNITYPADSICTITNGIKTYTAPDTSGSWDRMLYDDGEWIITCVNGDRKGITTIVIVHDMQNISATVEYFESFINITYTKGSICTCSYGDKTYTAPDTSGNWTCLIPNVGTWIVTVTDNTISKTTAVTITEDSQNVDVDIVLFEAYITVEYPNGSICTCSDGTDTLTAPDTSGSHTFAVYHSGLWTISCSNATSGERNSCDVNVILDGQTQKITISYKLHLYNAGNECLDVSGGWSGVAKKSSVSSSVATTPTVTRTSSYIEGRLNNYDLTAVLYATKAVNLTGYRKLVANGEFYLNGGFNNNLRLTVWTSLGTYYDKDIVAYSSAGVSTKTTKLEIDISNLSGNHTIGFIINTSNASYAYAKLTECYLNR